MKTSESSWQRYERQVAAWCSEEHSSSDISVTPNAKIRGSISNTLRQVDVLVEARLRETATRRVIVDAKRVNNKIDIKDVEQFEGMMRDCLASHGILVCPSGYTSGAKRRTQDAITIFVVTPEELDNFDMSHWDVCSNDRCNSRTDTGLVLWDFNFHTTTDGLFSIYLVGRCDRCRNFNIWCWACGEKFSLEDEDEHRCHCQSQEFWLTSIENDGDNLSSVYLFFISQGVIYPVDRKSLA